MTAEAIARAAIERVKRQDIDIQNRSDEWWLTRRGVGPTTLPHVRRILGEDEGEQSMKTEQIADMLEGGRDA